MCDVHDKKNPQLQHVADPGEGYKACIAGTKSIILFQSNPVSSACNRRFIMF